MRNLSDTLQAIIAPEIAKDNYFELRKEMIVRIFLYVATIILTLFTFINFFIYHKYSIAFVDTAASLISLFALTKLKNKKTLNLAITISSFNLFIFFLIFVTINKDYNNGFIWLIFLPIFIIPLNGHRKGLIITLLFYSIVFLIAYDGIYTWGNDAWTFHSYTRFVAASLVLIFVTYMNELAIYRSNILLHIKDEENKKYMKKLKESAQKDNLTKIYNRGKISEILTRQYQQYRSNEKKLYIAILDIDNFKKINDTYGHNIGDDVLFKFSQTVLKNLLKGDYFGRWGGEEFLLIFQESSLQNAKLKVEKVRQLIETTNFDPVKQVTCSIGLAQHNSSFKDIKTLLEQSDKALYKAKENGRNQVQV